MYFKKMIGVILKVKIFIYKKLNILIFSRYKFYLLLLPSIFSGMQLIQKRYQEDERLSFRNERNQFDECNYTRHLMIYDSMRVTSY